jgi:hypothetical protein
MEHTKMSNKAIVVTKNQGQLIGEAALSKAMEGHNAIGVAFVHEGELVAQKQPSPFDAESVKALQDEYKGNAIILCFQTLQSPINEEHVQPFEMADDDGTQLAVFIDAEVGSYATPKQPQTAEYQWFEKVFKPMFAQYVEKQGDKASLDGFVQHMQLLSTKGDLGATLGKRGVVKVLAATGEISTFNVGEGMFKDVWGEVSHGYSERTFPPAEVEQSGAKKKVLSLFGKKTKAEEPAAPPPVEPEKPAEEKPEGDKTVIHQPEPEKKAETAVVELPAAAARQGYIMARPKEQIRKNDKAMKKALGEVYNHGLPKGWKDTDWFEIPVAKLNNKWEKRGETAISSALEKAKEMTPQKAQIGLVPETQMKAFKETFMTSPSITEHMKDPSLPTMEKMIQAENKHPTWFDKTGIHVQDTLGWPPEKVEDLEKNYHDLYILRRIAINNMLVKMMLEHPPAKKEEAPKTEQVKEKAKLSLFKKQA